MTHEVMASFCSGLGCIAPLMVGLLFAVVIEGIVRQRKGK